MPLGCDAHQEDNACGAEVSLPAEAVLAVGVDDSVSGGKVFANLVMVGNENVHALLCGDFERIETR